MAKGDLCECAGQCQRRQCTELTCTAPAVGESLVARRREGSGRDVVIVDVRAWVCVECGIALHYLASKGKIKPPKVGA